MRFMELFSEKCFDKNQKYLCLIECKGNVGTTDFVRGIGQVLQYDSQATQEIKIGLNGQSGLGLLRHCCFAQHIGIFLLHIAPSRK